MLKQAKNPRNAGGVSIKGSAPLEWGEFFQKQGLTWDSELVCWLYPSKPLPERVRDLLKAQTSLEPDAVQHIINGKAGKHLEESDPRLQVRRGGESVALEHHTELVPGDTVKAEDNPSQFATNPPAVTNDGWVVGDDCVVRAWGYAHIAEIMDKDRVVVTIDDTGKKISGIHVSELMARQWGRGPSEHKGNIPRWVTDGLRALRDNGHANLNDRSQTTSLAHRWSSLPRLASWLEKASDEQYIDALNQLGPPKREPLPRARKRDTPNGFSSGRGRVTPVRQQYLDVKAQYPDCLLAFRLGDFYEFFDEDAEIVARELDLALTGRTYSRSRDKVPMCGFPHMHVEQCIAKLLERGYHIAVCDQVGEPTGNSPVQREVVRVARPGAPRTEPRWWFDGQWWNAADVTMFAPEQKPTMPSSVKRPPQKKIDKMVARFRTWANNEIGYAEKRETPGELNTDKRRRQYRSNLDKAKHHRIMSHVYQKLADLWESGRLWNVEWSPLEYITTKKVAEIIQRWSQLETHVALELGDDDMTTERYTLIREAWESLTSDMPEYNPEGMIRLREMELADRGIDQYFPTPRNIAEMMVRDAKLPVNPLVLEPSAGAGHILDVLMEMHPDAEVNGCEVNPSLVQVLRDKGYTIALQDFLKQGPDSSPRYDAVIMNPPFRAVAGIGRQDMAHIRHAYKFLKPGGRLVALAAQSIQSATNAKDLDYRTWLRDHNAQIDELAEGAFKDSDNPTSIPIVRIIIEKAEHWQTADDFPEPTDGGFNEGQTFTLTNGETVEVKGVKPGKVCITKPNPNTDGQTNVTTWMKEETLRGKLT